MQIHTLAINYVILQKILEKVVKTPQFHGHFGTLTKYNVNKQRRFVYFMRKTADGIPCLDMMEEATSEMPGHFQVGCTSEDMLQTLISSISRVSV